LFLKLIKFYLSDSWTQTFGEKRQQGNFARSVCVRYGDISSFVIPTEADGYLTNGYALK
jgi:hypothetical protein